MSGVKVTLALADKLGERFDSTVQQRLRQIETSTSAQEVAQLSCHLQGMFVSAVFLCKLNAQDGLRCMKMVIAAADDGVWL